MTIPWNRLQSEPVVLEIDQVLLVIRPKKSQPWNEEEEKRYENEHKQYHLGLSLRTPSFGFGHRATVLAIVQARPTLVVGVSRYSRDCTSRTESTFNGEERSVRSTFISSALKCCSSFVVATPTSASAPSVHDRCKGRVATPLRNLCMTLHGSCATSMALA